MKADVMGLESLPHETLVQLAKMFFKNQRNLDGYWFQYVEDEVGTETAVKIDGKIWTRHAIAEAREIKRIFEIPEEGPPSVMRALTYTLSMETPEYEVFTPERIVLRMTRCPMQEARLKQGRPEFPCREQGLIIYPGIAREIDSRVKVRCLQCPPDRHPDGFWCRWEYYL